MDYSRNCFFLVAKENNNLIVKKNKLDAEVNKLEIFKADDPKKIQYKTQISEHNFFTKNSNGIFLIKIYYTKEKETKNIRYFFQVKNSKLVLQRSSFPKKLSGSTKVFSENKFTGNKHKLKAEDYFKILKFYIIENPSLKDNKPSTAKFYDIKNYWGESCWKKKGSLKQKLIETVDNYELCVRKFNSENDSQESMNVLGLNDIGLFDNKTKIAFVDVCNNIFLSIFRHIRNGLAHGRFFIYKYDKTQMIFIEDKSGENVTARMTIPISILLKWIDIIKSKEV